MTKGKKFSIVIMSIIILVGGYFLLFNVLQKNNIDIIANTTTGKDYLIDDNINGLTGCKDQSVLSQFSGYKLVKKIDPYRPEYYDIYVYDMNLDLTTILDKEAKINIKAQMEKKNIEMVERRINGKGWGFDENRLSNLEERFRIFDKITIGDNECFLKSENFDPGDPSYLTVDKIFIDNLNIFLGDILSGKLNMEYLPYLFREKTSRDHKFTYKSYKDGILGIAAGGQDGYGVYLFYIKNIGDKIYSSNSDVIMYISPDDITINNDGTDSIHPSKLYDTDDFSTIIKDINCKIQTDCMNKTNNYIQNLFNNKETLPEYTNVYNKFTNTIDYIFE